MQCFIVDYAQHQIAIHSCQCGSWEALDYHPETISWFLCIWRFFFPDVSNDNVDVGTTGGEDPALHISAIGLAPNDILRWRNMVVTRVNILQLKESACVGCDDVTLLDTCFVQDHLLQMFNLFIEIIPRSCRWSCNHTTTPIISIEYIYDSLILLWRSSRVLSVPSSLFLTYVRTWNGSYWFETV